MVVAEPLECDRDELERCPEIPDESQANASDTWASRAEMRALYVVCALKHAGLARCIESQGSGKNRKEIRR